MDSPAGRAEQAAEAIVARTLHGPGSIHCPGSIDTTGKVLQGYPNLLKKSTDYFPLIFSPGVFQAPIDVGKQGMVICICVLISMKCNCETEAIVFPAAPAVKAPSISIIIPNRNGSATIGRCLEAAHAARDADTEIIVVDDCSTDGSGEIIRRFPCSLVRLDQHLGAGAARNAGARKAAGEYLFFIDADCLLLEQTLAAVRKAIREHPGAVIGGSYTPLPADADFFSIFQSVFIHFHETRRPLPDYIASHALVIRAEAFRSLGGFPERFLPLIEDVELSHRLRRAGHRLVMAPDILVRHIFRFTLRRSLANAFRKSRYWTVYSLQNGDVLSDSGTASAGLKMNVAAYLASVLIVFTAAASGSGALGAAAVLPVAASVAANRGLLAAFRHAKKDSFALLAALYYFMVYPAAVSAGAAAGVAQHLASPRLRPADGARR